MNEAQSRLLTVVGTGEPIESENLVEFHLLYTGQLHVNGSTKEKHAIRQALHPQLRRLWLTHPSLRGHAEHLGRTEYARDTRNTPNAPTLSESDAIEHGFAVMGKTYERNGFNFVPLVTKDVLLRCSLDILFLRTEEKGYILQGGDLDGRLKTLFDGLRLIRDGNELRGGIAPISDENPFFCLLQDDELITEVRVNANQLLMLPNTTTINEHDVYLQISVQLNPKTIGWGTYII